MATETEGVRPPVAREGWGYIAGLLLLAAFSALMGGWLWAAVFFAVGCGVAAFFRDPERTPPDDPGAVVSPADGRVIAAERAPDGRGRIGIFLSIYNVHINRSPTGGRIEKTEYRRGKFLAAFQKAAPQANEQKVLDIRTDKGENFRVVQIAGVLARRIVCWKKEGDSLQRGERFGLIQFGSRTDLHLPPEYEVCVKVGDRVRGGETIVAKQIEE